jgi:SAM-dependent methyltransferase
MSDEVIWQRWIDWLRTAPSLSTPAHAMAVYRGQLVASGKPDQAADRELSDILRMMGTRTEWWRLLFDNLYASPTPGFDTAPSRIVAGAVAGREVGSALDVATGQGRNAVHLAQVGWSVTAIDVSEEGLRVLGEAARAVGVEIETVLMSAEEFDFGSEAWDLIVMTYTPFNLTTPYTARRVVRALRHGGLLVVESYASDESAPERSPVDIDPDRFRAAYAELAERTFGDVVERGEWDPEPRRLVRFVGEKS